MVLMALDSEQTYGIAPSECHLFLQRLLSLSWKRLPNLYVADKFEDLTVFRPSAADAAIIG